MRKLLLVLALTLVACGARWRPPGDEVRVEANPGLFGWVEANTTYQGKRARQVTILVLIAGPQRLRGVSCTIQLNDRTYRFIPNPEHTWQLSGYFGIGVHHVEVTVGEIVRELTIRVYDPRGEAK